MNILDNLLIITKFSLFAKVALLVMDFLLTLFIIIAIKQVAAMHQIISDNSESGIITVFVYLLLIFAVSLFLAGLVIL